MSLVALDPCCIRASPGNLQEKLYLSILAAYIRILNKQFTYTLIILPIAHLKEGVLRVSIDRTSLLVAQYAPQASGLVRQPREPRVGCQARCILPLAFLSLVCAL